MCSSVRGSQPQALGERWPETSTTTVATQYRSTRRSQQRIYVINELGSNDRGLGSADSSFVFGNPGDKPFTGDFNNSRQDTVGLHRESTGFLYYRDTLTTGNADNDFFFGIPDDQIITGRRMWSPICADMGVQSCGRAVAFCHRDTVNPHEGCDG
jgi:hypothetical protein